LILYLIIFNFLHSPNNKAAVILVALVVIMSFDHWLWSLHFGVLFFWLVLGIIIKKEDKKINFSPVL